MDELTSSSTPPSAAMPEVQTFVLSEALLTQIRPLAAELGAQQKEAQRMLTLATILEAHLRLLVSREIGLNLNDTTDLQLDIARGIVRLQRA